MPRTLSDSQVVRLEEMHDGLGKLIEAIKTGQPRTDDGLPAVAAPAPQWIAEYRRSWKFLKALDEAGGRVTAQQISLIAGRNGYDPRGLGGFYTGDASLRRDGDYRELTEAGRRYIRQWEPEFGG
jgi:hypothetical protein